MCRIKEGADIRSFADLQNLVTSVILRQTTTFSLKDVCERIQEKATGSSFDGTEEITKCCLETISTLYLIDCVSDIGENKYKLTMTFPSTFK